MSLIIAVIAVLIVGIFIAKFFPTPKKIKVVEEQTSWNFDTYMSDLAPESTPEPTIIEAISEKITEEIKQPKKKPTSKNKAKVKPLAKMEAKKKTVTNKKTKK
jgi:hypothetical protein